MEKNNAAVPCRGLLRQHEEQGKKPVTHKLKFSGVDGYDVYNISREFDLEGITYIAGRVEKRDSEISCVRFFKKVADYCYELYSDVKLRNVQDPCVTFVDGELVVGGTQFDINPLNEHGIINWRSIFFKGKTIESLKYWFVGPSRMKDVRIFDLNEKQLLVLTRPQGGAAGMGKIGMTIVDKADFIHEKLIENAVVYDCHFVDREWGGANEIFRLKNNKIGVLGHIAYMDLTETECIRHYHSMVFCIDVEKKLFSKVKIIARRSDFEDGPYKRHDIADVLFSGGLIRRNNGKALLFTGVSDCEGHVAEIEDPFLEYEV